jgi:Tol biopolymer transport system component
MLKKKKMFWAILLTVGMLGAWAPGVMAQCPPVQATNTLVGDSDNPAVSGNGLFVAFESTSDITIANADGNSEIFLLNRTSGVITQITNTVAGEISASPAINAAGTMIAFESDADLVPAVGNADGNTEVFLFNTTTSAFTQVTNTIGATNDNVSISGDGTLIVFESDADLVPAVGNADGNTEIFIFNTTTSAFTQITNTIGGAINNAPFISADGTRVVFSSDADLVPAPGGPGNADGSQEIFLFTIATPTFTQVTNTAAGALNDNPKINASGTIIAFESDADLVLGSNADLNTEIFMVNTSATPFIFTQITNTIAGELNANPAINGAGTRVTFTSDGDLVVGQNADLNDEIFLFVTTTGILSQITNDIVGGSDNTAMDATGAIIAFESDGGGPIVGNQEIFSANCVVFADVPANNFAFEFVSAISDAGITAGCTATTFCPDNSITRGQMAVFIETSLGNPPATCTGQFTDVPTTHPFCGFIEGLAAGGITAGCTATAFCPDDPVSRGQMAVFIEAALGNAGVACTGQFTDVPTTHPFCGFIEQLADDGITGGCTATNFCPNDPVTRAQMAVFLVAAPTLLP